VQFDLVDEAGAQVGIGHRAASADAHVEVARRFASVLWLAHRKELIRQARKALDEAGLQRVAVKSVFLGVPEGRYDLLVLDEAHHAACKTLRAILDRHRESKVLGITATPIRADRKVLLFQECLEVADREALADAGWLVHAVVHSVRVTRNLEVTAWMEAHRDLVVPGVVFVSSHAEARRYADRLAGFRVAVVRPDSDRARLLADLAEGRLDLLVSCLILTEGVDLPPLRGVVIARNAGDSSAVLQMVGRAMRPSAGKDVCHLVEPVAVGVERAPIAAAIHPARHLIHRWANGAWTSIEAAPTLPQAAQERTSAPWRTTSHDPRHDRPDRS